MTGFLVLDSYILIMCVCVLRNYNDHVFLTQNAVNDQAPAKGHVGGSTQGKILKTYWDSAKWNKNVS